MNRKTLTAFGVFIVLGLLALVALRQPEKGERAADHPHPLPPLTLAQLTTIEVTRDGKSTTIKNDGAKYRIVAPVNYAADDLACKAAFEGLVKMNISDLVTEQPAKQAEFQVDDKTGIHLVVKHDATVLADLYVGKTEGAGTMVRLAGKNETWQASGITRYVYDKGPAEWRDKSITGFPPADAETLEVAAKDGSKITFKKGATPAGKRDKTKADAKSDKWELVSSSVKIDKLDDAVPGALVSALSTWKTNDFADGIQLQEAGLAPPALTITVGLKDGKSVTALIGSSKGDDGTYVKKADAPQVFLVKKYNLDRIDKRPIEFRDKTLCDLAAADVTAIAVASGDKSYAVSKSGADWKASKPAKLGELDSPKLTSIAGAFTAFKATGFAPDPSPKATGLVKPRAVITVKVKGKPGTACTIRVGDETKDKVNTYLALGKGPDVYLAPKWLVDRILVKPDELKKGATPPPAAPKPPHMRPGFAKR